MNAQKKVVEKIRAIGGDYTLYLKAKHQTLHEEIRAYFHKIKRDNAAQLAVHEEVDGGHGRV